MMDGLLCLMLAAFAGCVLLMIGVVVMGAIECVAGMCGCTFFQCEEEFDEDDV